MKRLFLLLILCLPVMLMAQKKVAVYVTSDDPKVDETQKEIIGGELVAAIVNTTQYKAVERTSDFLSQISKEQGYQHSGNVDDDQISALGKQFGVDYVCVANVIPYKNSYYIQARLIDVETATVQEIASETSSLSSMNEIISAAGIVANALLGSESKQSSAKRRETSTKDGKSFYAVTLNYSFVNNKFSMNQFDKKNEVWNGLNLGFFTQQKLYKQFVLITGLQYQYTAGLMYDNFSNSFFDLFENGSNRWHSYFQNHSLIVPLKFGYSMPFGKNSSFSVFAGPSLNFTVSTNVEYNDELMYEYYRSGEKKIAQIGVESKFDYVSGYYAYLGESSDTKIPDKTITGYHSGYSDEYTLLNWFDVPIGIGAFYSYLNYGFRVEYEFGVINRYRNWSDGNYFADLFTIGFYYSF